MWCAYNILVCAVYWICECTPLAITSLLPVVLLPLTGVVSTNDVCINYMKVLQQHVKCQAEVELPIFAFTNQMGKGYQQ